MALMFAPMNPQLYGSMMGGLVNPGLVGGANSTWGTFMYPNQPVVSLQPRAPLELPINLLDPTTYGNVLNIIPGMTLPSLPNLTGGQAAAAPGAASFPFNLVPSMPTTQTAAVAQPAAPAGFAVQSGVASTLTLGGDALFKTGKSSVKDLTPEGRAKLDDLVAKIKAFAPGEGVM